MQKAIADIYNRVNLLRLQRLIATMEFYRPKVQILALEDVQAEYRRVAGGGILKQKALPYVLCLLEKAIAECVGLWVRREQFLCALGLYHGYMCEMRAGEGKSLVAVIAAVLCATRGKVHIVTVNDYLARRDSERFNGVYRVFGLKCAHNYRGHPDKRELYQSDVVYTSSHELIFDYLRDELEGGRRNIRSLNTAIIDEVDFVLLDNATSRFSVSSGSFYMPNVEEYRLAKEICSVLDGLEVKRNLNGDVYAERLRREIGAHYVYSFRDGSLYLTVVGLDFLSRVFQKEDLLLASPGFCRAILDTLRAKHFFVRGRDYLVEGDRIVLINRQNGRVMPDSQVDPGVHTAIECKEGVPVTPKPLMAITLSYQTFFTKYRSIAGMSGTVRDAAEEFERLYGTGVLVIPSYSTGRVTDHGDMVFLDASQKYTYLLDLVRNRNSDQPLLVVAGSEAEAEQVAGMLQAGGIQVNLLTNRTAQEEDYLVEMAGRHGTVTVSTNMCGRGTDIVLDNRAREAGGLHVVCLGHYLCRRVDNQVKGRVGRQGDPGEITFLVSFDDEIWHYADEPEAESLRLLWGEAHRFPSYRKRVSAEIAKTQERLQYMLFWHRKFLFELDYIIETQRQQVLAWRDCLLAAGFDKTMSEIRKCFNLEGILFQESIFQQALEKREKLGVAVSDALFCKLIRIVVYNHWLVYNKELDDLKTGLHCFAMAGQLPLVEFIRMCADRMKTFKKMVFSDLITLFVNQGITARGEISFIGSK